MNDPESVEPESTAEVLAPPVALAIESKPRNLGVLKIGGAILAGAALTALVVSFLPPRRTEVVVKQVPAKAHVEPVEAPAPPVEKLPDLESVARNLVPQPPPAPPVVNEGMTIVDIGKWKPSVNGIVPNGWRVAADPTMEMEYSVPGVSIRGPIYRVVPIESSIYFLEPGSEGGMTVPAQLAATSRRLGEAASVCEQVSRALRALAESKMPPSLPPEGQSLVNKTGPAKETLSASNDRGPKKSARVKDGDFPVEH